MTNVRFVLRESGARFRALNNRARHHSRCMICKKKDRLVIADQKSYRHSPLMKGCVVCLTCAKNFENSNGLCQDVWEIPDMKERRAELENLSFCCDGSKPFLVLDSQDYFTKDNLGRSKLRSTWKTSACSPTTRTRGTSPSNAPGARLIEIGVGKTYLKSRMQCFCASCVTVVF